MTTPALDDLQDDLQPRLPVEAPPSVPPRAAWSPTAIIWITMLLSIFPAGIMYALNFERLGQPRKKKMALCVVLICSGLFYGANLLTALKPEWFASISDERLRVFSLVFTICAAWIFYLTQQPLFVRHIQQGGKKASVWPPVFWSLGAIVIVVGALLGYLTWQAMHDEQEFNRAVTLMQNEKYKEAETVFKEYQAKYPDEIESYNNLARIYILSERYKSARQELKAWLRLEPNNQEAKDLLQIAEEEEQFNSGG